MAHIPDGFLSAPVLAGTATASVAALAVAARRSRHQLEDRHAPVLGALTAFVFAAQMFNFPLGAGTSAHLLGGVLTAVIAGPWAATLALFSVVLVQALLFQDGGITALGANTLNLAVIGAGGGYLLYRWALALLGDSRRGRLAAAAFGAFLSALATGVAVGVELGLSGLLPLRTAVLAIGAAHLPVAAAEAVLTVGILAAVLRARPDLARDRAPSASGRFAVAAATIATAVALGAVGWASRRPDALESALASLGLGGHPAGGGVADVLGPWGGALAGLVAVAAIAWAVARVGGRGDPA